jgi:hypothetical protein
VPAGGPADSNAAEEGRITGFVPSEGQKVLDLDIPDETSPSEPRTDFLPTLQTHKDGALSK